MNKDMPLLGPNWDDKVFFWTSKYTEEEIDLAKHNAECARLFKYASKRMDINVELMESAIRMCKLIDSEQQEGNLSIEECLICKQNFMCKQFAYKQFGDVRMLNYC